MPGVIGEQTPVIDPVVLIKPVAKIDIGTPPRTEGSVLFNRILIADGALHGIITRARGTRSRLRVISRRPIRVHPIMRVGTAS